RDFHVTGVQTCALPIYVLIAAESGGQNVYYIGYNQDMAVEYIEACAMWARAFDYAASEIEEGIWEDDPDKHIKTFTIRFPSGKRSEERRVGNERRAKVT